MIINIIVILIFIISIILTVFSYNQLKNVHTINRDIDNKNFNLKSECDELEKELKHLESKQFQERHQLELLNEKKKGIQQKVDVLNEYLSRQDESIEQSKKVFYEVFENYCDILDNKYEMVENDYDNKLDALENRYEETKIKIIEYIQREKEKLNKIRATRAAAQEAINREEEIKANKSFYCLTPSDKDLQDYSKLNSLKPMLNNQRILSMLLWQTFYQPLAKKQFPLILGTKTVIGIYKITNQITGQSYIGQAVDVDRRWKEHCKCGLGIDTPAGNKLYKAMEKDGLQNFSFELLEECKKEELNEKEKYYIELYDTYNFGYNNTKGNK